MSEFVLALPFLLLVLSLVVYFGRGSVRVQHAAVMDRYEAWRQAAQAPGPRSDDAAGHAQLNATFYNANADRIHIHGSDRLATRPMDDLVAAARSVSSTMSAIAATQQDVYPWGRTVAFTTGYDNPILAWEPFHGTGDIDHGHTRIDHEWKYANGWRQVNGAWVQTGGGPRLMAPAGQRSPLGDAFFADLDHSLEGVGGDLAWAVRRAVYHQEPGYIGPTVASPRP